MSSTTGVQRRHALEVLGLTGSPSRRELTSAYRRRARATHPDTAPAAHSTADAAQFTAVVEAYRLLSRSPSSDPVPVPSSAGGACSGRPLRWAGQRTAPVVAGPVTFVPEGHGVRHG